MYSRKLQQCPRIFLLFLTWPTSLSVSCALYSIIPKALIILPPGFMQS
uniref:Uncharacterized protein n=1 Tax=Arundo donax TaxID=35708 RepID=A0A0A9B663_ARUDO